MKWLRTVGAHVASAAMTGSFSARPEGQSVQRGKAPMIGLLYGHFASNLGDVAITKGIALHLRNTGKKFCFVVPPLSAAGNHALEQLQSEIGALDIRVADHGLEAALKGRKPEPGTELHFLDDLLLRPQSILARNGVEDCDTLAFVGGEHLFSNGSARDINALAGRLLPCLAGIAAGRKVIGLPSTFGPFNDPLARSVVRTFLKGCSAAAAREPASLEHIASLGSDLPDVPVLLDSAFHLRPPPPQQPEKGLVNMVMRLDQFGMRIGGPESSAALKSMRENSYSGSASIHLSAHLIAELLRMDLRVQVLVQTDADAEIATAITKRAVVEFDVSPDRLSVQRPATIKAFIRELARGQCTISSRFHAIIFSALAGRPSIGIYFPEHGHKLPGLMSMLGLQEFTFDGTASQAPEIASALDVLLEKAEDRSQEMANTVAKLKQETEDWLQRAFCD